MYELHGKAREMIGLVKLPTASQSYNGFTLAIEG